MITVKALKPTSQQSQPTRENYVEQEQEKRRFLPLTFLLFLTGCAAYLKSFLPVKLEAREERQDSKHDDDTEPSKPQTDDEIGAATEEDANTGTIAKSSDNVVPIRIVLPPDVGDLLASDSPPIDFKGLARPAPVRLDGRPIGDPVRARNDNRPAAQSNSGGGGGGGGGGGDGGGDDKQREPRAPNLSGSGGADSDLLAIVRPESAGRSICATWSAVKH
jgi:hypothetical protein